MELEALKITLDYVELVGAAHAFISDEKMPCHIDWVPENSCPDYPGPFLTSLVPGHPHSRPLTRSILSLMRFPGLYDGGADFIFERTVGSTIRSMFAPWCEPYIP